MYLLNILQVSEETMRNVFETYVQRQKFHRPREINAPYISDISCMQ
jgi:hypothetical protein